MTNKQKMAIVRQMMDMLKSLPAGKHISTASLLGKVDIRDEEFLFDAEDMEIFHDALMQQAKREHLHLALCGKSFGMPYLDEFTVTK